MYSVEIACNKLCDAYRAARNYYEIATLSGKHLIDCSG